MRRMIFEVEGNGTFPYDMLRYDACHPRSQTDVVAMVRNTSVRPVQLAAYVRYADAKPTIDRWASFGWNCRLLSNEKA